MKADEKIYGAYLKSKQDKLYFNQVKEYTSLSNSSLQNALNKLVQDKTLKLNKTKSNTFYQINNKKQVALKFSEIAARKFSKLNIGVKVPLRDFIRKISKTVFTIVLFGSASTKEEQDGSDIDLLIVSDSKINLKEIRKDVEATSKYPISIFECSSNQFLEGKDHVIIQAKKTGFPIYKEQNFYEAILDEY